MEVGLIPENRSTQVTVARTILIAGVLVAEPAFAAEEYESTPDLAMQLASPVAALISVPLQLNYDQGIGPEDDGTRWSLNIQPVVPFQLNDDWNIISRTILPIVYQSDVLPGAGSQTGIGDTVQSVFFSPRAPTAGGWTPGVLANHIWSFAGQDNRPDISNTLVQPFASLTTPTSWTYSLSSEVVYNWEDEEWAIPVNFSVAKLTKVGSQLVSLGGGARYWADSPTGGPDGFGLRLFVTLLFPR